MRSLKEPMGCSLSQPAGDVSALLTAAVPLCVLIRTGAAPTATGAASGSSSTGATTGSKRIPSPNRTDPQRTRLRTGALQQLPGALAEKESDEDTSSDDGSVGIAGEETDGSPDDVPPEVIDVGDEDDGAACSDDGNTGSSSSDGDTAIGSTKSNSSSSAKGKGKAASSSRGRGGRGRARGRGRTVQANSSSSSSKAVARAVKLPSKRKGDKHMPQLTDDDWCKLSELRTMLNVFYEATTQLEGEKYVTCSMVPLHIKAIVTELEKLSTSYDSSISATADLLLADLRKRWQEWPRAIYINVALDPRTKRMSCFDAQQKTEAWRLVKEEMASLERHKVAAATTTAAAAAAAATATATSSPQQQQQPQRGGSSSSAPRASSGSSSSTRKRASIFESDADDTHSDDGTEVTTIDPEYFLQSRIDNEIKLFKELGRLDPRKDRQTPFEWWRSAATAYPLLAAVARKWLAVPASSAASERLFSSAGLTVSKKRTRLGTDRVSTLVFLKTAWPTLQRKGLLHGAHESIASKSYTKSR